jgi:hypothetical protein
MFYLMVIRPIFLKNSFKINFINCLLFFSTEISKFEKNPFFLPFPFPLPFFFSFLSLLFPCLPQARQQKQRSSRTGEQDRASPPNAASPHDDVYGTFTPPS